MNRCVDVPSAGPELANRKVHVIQILSPGLCIAVTVPKAAEGNGGQAILCLASQIDQIDRGLPVPEDQRAWNELRTRICGRRKQQPEQKG